MSISTRFEEVWTKLNTLEKTNTEKNAELQSMQKDIQAAQKDNYSMLKEVMALQKQNNSQKEKVNTMESDMLKCKDLISDLEERILQKEKDNDLLTNKMESLKEEYNHRIKKTEDNFSILSRVFNRALVKAYEDLDTLKQNSATGMSDSEFNVDHLHHGRAQENDKDEEAYSSDESEDDMQATVNPNRSVNLYIKNLDKVIDDKRLCKEFSQFGTIISAKVMRDDSNQSKGFGFVSFRFPREATKAIYQMNGRMIECKSLYVGVFQRKEDRRRDLLAKQTYRPPIMRQQCFPFPPRGYVVPSAMTQAQRGIFTPPALPLSTTAVRPSTSEHSQYAFDQYK